MRNFYFTPGNYQFQLEATCEDDIRVSDIVNVTVANAVTKPDAGSNEYMCIYYSNSETVYGTFAANAAGAGETGLWSTPPQQDDFTIDDPTDPNSGFSLTNSMTGGPPMTHTFTGLHEPVNGKIVSWTVTRDATIANPDESQTTITDTLVSFSGRCLENQHPFLLTGYLSNGTYRFVWQLDKGGCASSLDTVMTTNSAPLSVANAGLDIDTCSHSFRAIASFSIYSN